MRISEAFEMYRSDVIVFSNQSTKTEENHLIVMRNLVESFGDINISDITFSQVRDWKQELSKTRSPETVRNYIIKLRVVLGFLLKRGLKCLDPETIPVPKRTDKVPVFLTEQQVCDVILAAGSIRAKAIVSLLYASGIRVSELCQLDRGDLHDRSFTVVGKGGKARLCFYDERADTYIKEYLATRDDNISALFITNQTNRRMNKNNISEIFRNIKRKTGLEAHAHTFRHSFATNLMKNGMHIYKLQRLLGHSSIQTTQMYLHTTDIDLQRDYKKYHSVV